MTEAQSPAAATDEPERELHFPSFESFGSVAKTVEILSDAWSFLVLRECFFGARRFEQYQRLLRLPRNTLIKRLNKLIDLGLLRRQSYSPSSTRFEYRFTDKGRDLYATMIALLKYGDTWLAGDELPPLQLIHKRCGKACTPAVVCSECNEPIDPHEIQYRKGPGNLLHAHAYSDEERKRSRRPSDPQILERVRPCSVARTLQIIGDRWSFLLIREMFFGVRRFDEFQANIGIASNILTDRLQRLTEYGVVEKRLYQVRPERFEYRFTSKGRDLYGSMLVMRRWGDKWLFNGKAPLILRHRRCQNDFFAKVVCSECGGELNPHEMAYELRYELDLEQNNEAA
ncbi:MULTISPECIES: helix-turn-helix domain-containing protein [unclassified Herbaspirillum]|uniref:winged helix-turn-helix transcriptional regulator n=1 Tax=unclassified Herbaspirillum TaxID=2624150 RepID=UPI000980F95C|nr:helix-turn-helix domain-containing protein [Herbaspirillum sp. VT-16-41]ONN64886.1 transcriptional regulator [Herbaspirillum sp. VT-16-41]